MENGTHGNWVLIREVKRQKSYIAKDTKLSESHRFTWSRSQAVLLIRRIKKLSLTLSRLSLSQLFQRASLSLLYISEGS